MRPLRIGTRGSPLARWQAAAVADAIARRGGPQAELVRIRTSGDRLSRAPISEAGGKRLFVKEIEDALAGGRIDLAVHSAKDVPAERLPGLSIRAVLPRADPHDCIVAPRSRRQAATDPATLLSSAPGAAAPRVGTGSIRRAAQLRRAWPDVNIDPIRGNVGTRLRKLDAGEVDLLVLASAGLARLNLEARIAAPLPFDLCVPAPGQGILVAEHRTDDRPMHDVLAAVGDPESSAALAAERAVVRALGADCQVPLGAVAILAGGELRLRAVVASTDGSRLVRREARAPVAEASRLGREVAAALLDAGAGELLAAVAAATPS